MKVDEKLASKSKLRETMWEIGEATTLREIMLKSEPNWDADVERRKEHWCELDHFMHSTQAEAEKKMDVGERKLDIICL